MHAEHRLAVALGTLDAVAVVGDDELSRKQLIRAGEAMVGTGLAIVLNQAGKKEPLCTLTAVEKKRADQEARDIAAAGGDPRSHLREHACGLSHAITDPKTATRVLTRISRRERFNIGVEPRASRVVIVDLDTAKQAAEFALRCGQDRPGLTVRSPGQRDKDGKWVHKDGGHIWFDVPDGLDLPTNEGVYTDDAGWTAVWGEHQVLVPPSVRIEGPYVLVGSAHPLPQWLIDLIITESTAKQERREEARRRRENSKPSGIDDWAARTTWDDILTPAGWTKTGLIKNCGCPQWTAPGDHASPESATAHEPGCSIYVGERGHLPLYVWTDNPGEAVAAAIAAFRSKALTKAQVITYTEGNGQMRRTLTELGVEFDGDPTVLKRPFSTWEDETTVIELAELTDDFDEDSPVPPRTDDADYGERMIRLEVERELRRRAALERIQAMDAEPLRMLSSDEFLDSPRPVPLVNKMLYRDSLARMFGAPGGGKSFLAIDVALALALGRFWGGVRLKPERVVYVMAEGQAVNGDRTEAWLSRHGVARAQLSGQLFVVPDAVMLTESGAARFVAKVAELRPVLVILDTKNAMMVGEENSASDFAVLRRTMDAIRKAADCCVLLVDHTGYEGTRARGSSAGTAAMDTEIRVTKDDEQRPALVTAEVTRDKASEAGAAWAFHLVPEHPAAVLVGTDMPEDSGQRGAPPAWLSTSPEDLPVGVRRYDGRGKNAIIDLARCMQHDTGREQDPSRIGLSRAEVCRALKLWAATEDSSTRRAWSALKSMGWIIPAGDANEVGKHIWVAKNWLAKDPVGDQQ